MTSTSQKKQRLSQYLTSLRDKYLGMKIVFVSGNFNIVHPGHLRLLNFAQACGDVLVVGLFSDHTPGVIVGFEDRKSTLLGLESVSDVFELSQDMLLDALRVLKPHTVVKGKEHEGLQNIEQEAVSEFGGHLIFSSGEQKFSSRDLIRQELRVTEALSLRTTPAFLGAHGISNRSMIERVKSFNGARVVVIGDLIIDDYVYCDPLGMSQEDPTLVVTPIESKKFLGAAGIVAAHLSGLGASVNYFSIIGGDSTGRLAQEMLVDYGVDPVFVIDQSRPTILKQRYRAQNKTLLRVSHLRSHEASLEFWIVLLGLIKQKISKTDLVVFSDFNYGCLPQNLVNQVCALCQEHNIPYVADSQASSQVGDVSRFVGSDFLSATEREARLAMGDFRSGLQNVANLLFKKARSNGLFVKLGPEGLILVMNREAPTTISLPALNPNPVDVAGAGDAFLSVSSLCRVSGGSLQEAAYLGSIAAAIQVARQGNVPLQRDELLSQINRAN